MRKIPPLISELYTCDEQLGSFRRHDARVRNRARHCDVTVQRDGAQVQDGGCAHPYVHSKPDFTPNVTEDPHLPKTNQKHLSRFYYEYCLVWLIHNYCFVSLLIIYWRIHVDLTLNHSFVKAELLVPSSDVEIMVGKVFFLRASVSPLSEISTVLCFHFNSPTIDTIKS